MAEVADGSLLDASEAVRVDRDRGRRAEAPRAAVGVEPAGAVRADIRVVLRGVTTLADGGGSAVGVGGALVVRAERRLPEGGDAAAVGAGGAVSIHHALVHRV